MLFDTHAHLDDTAFDGDREELLRTLPEQGIGWLMDPACSRESAYRVVSLAERYRWIYAAVGAHPDAAEQVDEDFIAQMRRLAASPKVKAIGEIGLDYHYEDIPRDIQQAAFRRQLRLAEELDLPVIVHDREAHGDCLEILRDHPDVKGVFHCFSGSAEMAEELVKKGWYIGFTGVITFKNARKTVEVAQRVPLDRILIETDCPYMAPEPFRGRRNQPGYVYRVAEKLAEIRGISPEEMQKITQENGKAVYRI